MNNQLHINGPFFIDSQNRVVLLHGINLAGVSIPFSPEGATHHKDSWPPTDLEHVSWIGRPFPQDEFDTHFKRLKDWGFNCLRLLTSWEAVEHAGPYRFDEKYIQYFTELVRSASRYGFHSFINFHQDVWSRVTGGDGSPLWLFDKVGLDYTKFDAADAAHNMQFLWDSNPKKNRYQKQSWGENTKLFPPRTMWTLFWAGKDLAPKLSVLDEQTGEFVNIQEYLQNHFIKAFEQIVTPLKDDSYVFGINPINEPSRGYIGMPVSQRPLKLSSPNGEISAEPGIAWSPLDTMMAAAGHSVEIEELGINLLKGLSVKRIVKVNPEKIRIWKPNAIDFWQDHNVWTDSDNPEKKPTTQNESYFKIVRGHSIDFTQDYLVPFHLRIMTKLRSLNPHWICLMETDPYLHGPIRSQKWPNNVPSNMVDAFHWYDITQLALKRFLWPIHLDIMRMRPVFGTDGIQAMYKRQIEPHTCVTKAINQGNCPILIGEFGIAMDMTNKKAYRNFKAHGLRAFKWHEKILDLMYNAQESFFLSSTLWNYAANNSNKWGDEWNLEDLSIFSRDQIIPNEPLDSTKGLASGARGIGAFSRPYPQALNGIPLKNTFDRHQKRYELHYKPNVSVDAPTEIFISPYHYPDFPTKYSITLHEGKWEYHGVENVLLVNASGTDIVRLIIAPKKL